MPAQLIFAVQSIQPRGYLLEFFCTASAARLLLGWRSSFATSILRRWSNDGLLG